MNTKVKYIFVYGTLQVGGRLSHNHDALRGLVRKACIKGDMYNIADAYPAVINIGSDNTVHGELHEYSDIKEALRIADRIEGCYGDDFNNLYNRVLVHAKLESGDLVQAWVYVYNNDKFSKQDYKQIKEGVWVL